jgi:hypothetical protein
MYEASMNQKQAKMTERRRDQVIAVDEEIFHFVFI